MLLSNKFFKIIAVFGSLLVGQLSLAEDLPVVPVDVLKKGKVRSSKPAEPAKPVGESKFKAVQVNQNTSLMMEPGINQIIPIAIGHPNRIITPFSEPEITSTSLGAPGKKGECGEICIKDNVIYVATNKKLPVTMFVTEKGSQHQAISLTMIPRKIPPREVSLEMKSGQYRSSGFVKNVKAKSWEESNDYMVTLRNVLRELAKNNIPRGYTMNPITPDLVLPACSHKRFKFDFSNGQYVRGHHLGIFVGVVSNVSEMTTEVKEAACGQWDVAAVAVWPRVMLRPGEKTEVFVVVKNGLTKPVMRSRPSLIGGVL